VEAGVTANDSSLLYVVAGIAATRAALVSDGRIKRIFEAPGSVPVERREMTYRDAIIGRVTRVSKQLKGAFVDIGASSEAFLPTGRKASPPNEGAFIAAVIKRPSIGDKGAVLSADLRRSLFVTQEEMDTALRSKKPGVVGSAPEAACGIFRYVDAADVCRIHVTSPDAMRQLQGFPGASDINFATALESVPDIHAAIDDAIERTQALSGGGRLILDETEGGCVIDVDAGAANETASSANDRVNMDAAGALFDLLGQRGIGGRVIVDFIAPSKPAAKASLFAAVERAAICRSDAKLGILRNDGLFDMTLPKTGLSFATLARSDADWRLRHVLCKLERRLRLYPKARFVLNLPGDLAAIYDAGDRLQAAFAKAYPARFVVARTEKPEAEIVENA
jgi:Ribonuclease G/E